MPRCGGIASCRLDRRHPNKFLSANVTAQRPGAVGSAEAVSYYSSLADHFFKGSDRKLFLMLSRLRFMFRIPVENSIAESAKSRPLNLIRSL